MTPRAHPVAALVFAVLILGGAVVGLVVAGFALVGATTPSATEVGLREAAELTGSEGIQAWHSEGGDAGPTGCLLTDTAVLRLVDGRVVRRVPTRGARARLQNRPLQVSVSGADGQVACPFRAGEGVDVFFELVLATVERTSREAWRPVDPRVQHLFDEAEAPGAAATR